MEQFRFQRKDLSDKEELAALTLALINKGILTAEDVIQGQEAMVEEKNRQLDENPGAQKVMDLFGNIFK